MSEIYNARWLKIGERWRNRHTGQETVIRAIGVGLDGRARVSADGLAPPGFRDVVETGWIVQSWLRHWEPV